MQVLWALKKCCLRKITEKVFKLFNDFIIDTRENTNLAHLKTFEFEEGKSLILRH